MTNSDWYLLPLDDTYNTYNTVLFINPYSTELLLFKPWGLKGYFQFKILPNVSVSYFWFIWIPMLLFYEHHKYAIFLSAGRLYTSEFYVYRRQILTYKDGPRAKRVMHTYDYHSNCYGCLLLL